MRRVHLLTFSYHEAFRCCVACGLSILVDVHEVLLLLWVLKHHIWVVDLLPNIFLITAIDAALRGNLNCLYMHILDTTSVRMLLYVGSLLGFRCSWVLALWVWFALDYILEQSEFLLRRHRVMTAVHSHVKYALIWWVWSLEKVVGLRVEICLVPHSSLDVSWRNSSRLHGRVRYLACLCTSDL